MRTDTRLIPVITGTPLCSWCRIPLTAIPDDEIVRSDGTFHPTCVEAHELDANYPTAPLPLVTVG